MTSCETANPCPNGAQSVQPTADRIISSLPQMVADAYAKPLLRAFGAPAPQPPEAPGKASVVALHLATAFYRLAIVLDVLRFYGERSRLPKLELVPLVMMMEALAGQQPRAVAERLYRQALVVSPNLAEAHYALACLSRDEASHDRALDGYAAALRLSPHLEAPAHAYLHANAHWERATIFEDLGLNAEALIEYRAALARLDKFGVHHIRVARFFRRLGLLEEAAEHFRRCMTYSHRYFAEFILPPLQPPRPPVSPMVEVIHTNRRGEQVVFWQGAYFSVPQMLWPVSPKELEDVVASMAVPHPKGVLGLLRRLVDQRPPTIRRASSIAALEDLP